LTNPRGVRLERFSIRSREASVTLSAWRLDVGADEGSGTITLVEGSPGPSFFRGDGVFLGWPQGRLSGAYEALVPKTQAVAADVLPQLG
jgi:hypothetical protein